MMETMLDTIYTDPKYPSITMALRRGDRRDAYVQVRTLMGDILEEKEIHQVLAHIQLYESWLGKLGEFISGVVGLIPQVFKYFLSVKDPSALIKTVKSRQDELRRKADEVAIKFNIEVHEADAKDLLRKLQEAGSLQVPEEVARHAMATVKLKEHADDNTVSASGFVIKWVLLYIVFNVVVTLTGGAGVLWNVAPGFITRIVAAHIPILFLVMSDLAGQLEGRILGA